ncbi:MAG: rod shape-determining protein MreD [Alphaproteobacteria bacterium]|nr:rod shape-determining protein MreD [Alphaproteobacteria bacterium]
MDGVIRHLLPAITAILFVLLGVVQWPLPYLGAVTPSLALIAVYYWAVHRPDLFRPSSAFVVGLLYDAINGYPFGMSALIFVAIHQLALTQRRFFAGHSFFMMWSGFVLTMLCAMVANWLAMTLWNWDFMPLMPIFIQALFTVVIFPIPAWMLIKIQRGLLGNG